MAAAPAILMLGMTAAVSALATPYVPADGQAVLETLPNRNDPLQRELAELRKQAAAAPGDVGLAAQLARRYIDAGRAEGDPRYFGYAQAALAPWWRDKEPPAEAHLLRATLLQNQHQFAPALADLDALLQTDRLNVQALLTRATVLQVQGRFAEAKQACLRLYPLAPELVSVACVAGVASLTGQARQSHALLRTALARDPGADAGVRAWALTLLADMARRTGDPAAAERHFRDAFATGASDSYLLAAYADFLLEQGRAAEVISLLKGRLRVDALLLRYAQAKQVLKEADAGAIIAMTRDRFRAAELRGDTAHLREQARFTLRLLGDAPGALDIARRNWQVQKEPADALILLEAALAARDAATARQVVNWVRGAGLEDPAIARLAALTGDTK